MEGNTGFQLDSLVESISGLVTQWGLRVVGALGTTTPH